MRASQRILVAGGSQGVGRLAAVRLVQLGRPTTVMSRTPGKGQVRGADLLAADALDERACRDAVRGCSEVICTLGAPYDGTFVSVAPGQSIVDGQGVINLARAAQDAGVRRFVLVSSLGVAESWDWLPGLVQRFFERVGAVPLLEAKAQAERFLRDSSLDWTILRPGFLTNGAMVLQPWCVEGPAPGITTRHSTADVCVRALSSPASSRRTLTVVNGIAGLAVFFRPRVVLETPWTSWPLPG